MTSAPFNTRTRQVDRTASFKARPAKRQRRRLHVEFIVDANAGSNVCLAGSFNDWDPTTLPLCDAKDTGEFRVVVPLVPGEYQYKFVIDGVWQADTTCPRWTVNEHGSLNSVLEVGERESEPSKP